MGNRRLVLIVVASVAVVGVGLIVWLARKSVPIEPLPTLPAVGVEPVVPQPAVVPRYTLRASLPRVEKAPAYAYKSDVAAQFTALWSGVLGFSGEPKEIKDVLEGTLYLWSREEKTLVVNENGSRLSYSMDLLADPETLSGSFLPSFESAAEIVERTLTELGSVSDLLEYDPQKSKVLAAGAARVREVNVEEAELVEVHFTAKIADYPIYLSNPPLADPVLAWIGKDGKLLRLEYNPVGTAGEKIADYPLKNAEEVLQDLDNGKGAVVSSNLSGGEEIISVVITKADLGYLLPRPNGTTIQPIFVLSGQARTAKNKTGQVVIYLTAVR